MLKHTLSMSFIDFIPCRLLQLIWQCLTGTWKVFAGDILLLFIIYCFCPPVQYVFFLFLSDALVL